MPIAAAINLAFRAHSSPKARACLRRNTCTCIAAIRCAYRDGAIIACIAWITDAIVIPIDANSCIEDASALIECAKIGTVYIVYILSNRAIITTEACIAVAFPIQANTLFVTVR